MIAVRFVLLFVGTVLAILFIIQLNRGKESAYLFENLDSNKYPLSGLYPVGYAWASKGILRFKGDFATELKMQAAMLYEPQYCEYYASTTWYQTITLVHFFLTLTFLIAGWMYGSATFILIVGLAISAVAGFFFMTQMKNNLSERTEKCEAQLPEVVSTMAILVNSGMVLKDAWALVAEKSEGEFSDLMKIAVENMKNGYSDADAIFLFGKASNSGEIKKFVSALLQSMEKGGAELSLFLANQSSELWKLKRQNMLQAGEKAATKLLAPIVLIFVGVIIVVITAAFAGMLF